MADAGQPPSDPPAADAPEDTPAADDAPEPADDGPSADPSAPDPPSPPLTPTQDDPAPSPVPDQSPDLPAADPPADPDPEPVADPAPIEQQPPVVIPVIEAPSAPPITTAEPVVETTAPPPVIAPAIELPPEPVVKAAEAPPVLEMVQPSAPVPIPEPDLPAPEPPAVIVPETAPVQTVQPIPEPSPAPVAVVTEIVQPPPPEPVVVEAGHPLQRTFTTPSGQTVTVVELAPHVGDEVKQLPVVEELKPSEIIPVPLAQPTTEVAVVPEQPKTDIVAPAIEPVAIPVQQAVESASPTQQAAETIAPVVAPNTIEQVAAFPAIAVVPSENEPEAMATLVPVVMEKQATVAEVTQPSSIEETKAVGLEKVPESVPVIVPVRRATTSPPPPALAEHHAGSIDAVIQTPALVPIVATSAAVVGTGAVVAHGLHKRHKLSLKHHLHKAASAPSVKQKAGLAEKSSRLSLKTHVDRVKTMHKDVCKHDVLPPVVTPAILDKPIGIFRPWIARGETDLLVKQHVYSISGNDFTVTDPSDHKMFHFNGSVLSATACVRFMDGHDRKFCEMRKRLARLRSSWYITADKIVKMKLKSQLSVATRSIQVTFENLFDKKHVDLFLKGNFAETKGAMLHLGKDDKGPVVAKIVRDVMNASQIMHGRQTYRVHVVRNFDMAIACAVSVAFEDRDYRKSIKALAKK